MRRPSRSGVAQRHGRGERVLRIVAGQHLKQQFDVLRRARHRSGYAQQSARMADFGNMARRRDATRRGLQSGDAAEMGGYAHRSSAVAADSAGRTKRRDRRRLAAAGSARGARQIPRIVRAPDDVVVGLVIGQKLRAIRFGERDRPGLFETADRRGVVPGPQVLEEPAAAGGRRARPISKLSLMVTGTRAAGPRIRRAPAPLPPAWRPPALRSANNGMNALTCGLCLVNLAANARPSVQPATSSWPGFARPSRSSVRRWGIAFIVGTRFAC